VSGGEIVDFALKMARAQTGRKKIIAMKKGYHGCTGFSVSATENDMYKSYSEPMVEDVVHVAFNDVKALKRKIDKQTAAVILEPIQGHGGVNLPDPEYLASVRELCDEYGALMIVDEIMTGLGRTGTFFAMEDYGVVPDIITVGKALSGGVYPITAAVFKPYLLQFWNDQPFSHLSTFGGSDLGCIVALEVIAEIERKNMARNAMERGKEFEQGFRKLQEQFPDVIKEFRGKGLLMALELQSKDDGPEMSSHLSEVGVLSEFLFSSPQILRIMPPMVITKEEVQLVLNAFEYALDVTKENKTPVKGLFSQAKAYFQDLKAA
jgi:putrescine aminotransferase